MKKIISIVLVTMFAFLALSAAAFSSFAEDLPRVIDYTNTLTESEISEFEEMLSGIREKYSYDAVVVLIDNDTVSELQITSLEVFADDMYDYGGYGVGENNDGVLVVLRLGEPYHNHFHLCTTGILVAACTEEDIDYMYDGVKPYLEDEDAYGAVKAAIKGEEEFFVTAKNREEYIEKGGDINNLPAAKRPFRYVKNILICLAIGFVIGGITVLVMKSKLKSVASKNNAADYVVPGSFALFESRDIFLYANVTKTPRAQESSRGGSGGAGAHFSSSGVSHGGGTR